MLLARGGNRFYLCAHHCSGLWGLRLSADLDDEANRLATLRAELDGIDDALHALLTRRAGLVGAVAREKVDEGAGRLRPGREAAVLRRLLGQTAPPLPAAMVVRIWRELFAGSVALQGPFSVAVADGPAASATVLAREQFGALTPIEHYGDAELALAALPRASVAVLPAVPGWWLKIVQAEPRRYVVGRLPFWRGGSARMPDAEAYAVAAVPPDASGDDCSLVAVPLDGGDDAALLRRHGLDDAVPVERAGGLLLARLDRFVDFARPPVPLLLGAYARPIGDQT